MTQNTITRRPKFASFSNVEEASVMARDFSLVNKGQERVRDGSYADLHKRFCELKDLLELATRNHKEFGSESKGFFDALSWAIDQDLADARQRGDEQGALRVTRSLHGTHLKALHCLGIDPELYAFVRRCQSLDWYCDYSDDGSVARAGNACIAAAEAEAKEKGQAYIDAFNRCKAVAFHNTDAFTKVSVDSHDIVGKTVTVRFRDGDKMYVVGGIVMVAGLHTPQYTMSARRSIVIEADHKGERIRLRSYGFDAVYGQQMHFAGEIIIG